MSEEQNLHRRIKLVIVKRLRLHDLEPEEIGDEEPLFGEGLGLDSVDALELVVGLEKEFGIRIASDSMDRSAFACVDALARFIEARINDDSLPSSVTG